MTLCECGCGLEAKPGNRFIFNHHGRKKLMGDNNPAKRPEVRKKISESKIGDKNPAKRPDVRKKISDNILDRIAKNGSPLIGYKHSLEYKLACSIRNSGKNNPMYGRTGENSSNWQGGISFGEYCNKFNNEFKEMIRDLFGRRCFLCGITEEEYSRKFDVHHVNYDKDCLCNSSCEFVPLCRSCHGKTYGKYVKRYWEDLIMCYLYPDRITIVDL